MTAPLLLLTPRYTADSRAVRAAALERGWAVTRMAARRVPESAHGRAIVYYGEPDWAGVVMPRHVSLLRPSPTWLTTPPERYRKRAIRAAPLAEAQRDSDPAFVKPAREKRFPIGVYQPGSALLAATAGLPETLPVLVAEPVKWAVEIRCFVLDRRVVALSPYARSERSAQSANGDWPFLPAEREHALDFIRAILDYPTVSLPAAVVVDIGVIVGRGWAVVEANEAWAAGLYGCEASAILPVLARTSVSPNAMARVD